MEEGREKFGELYALAFGKNPSPYIKGTLTIHLEILIPISAMDLKQFWVQKPLQFELAVLDLQKKITMNKNIITNVVALAVAVGGHFSPAYSDIILMTGLFALSGGLTNWLAVHMLFEKVPLLYGSGIIPNRFEEFKAGIKNLIIQEFFAREHIERFLNQHGDLSATALNDKIDFDRVFEGLVDAIVESPMGSMLGMLGGKKALLPLKEPIIEKLKEIIAELASTQTGGDSSTDFTAMLSSQVEQIIDNRLAELTPEQVKDIIQEMIHKHLGWLVVWGGVFGGIIGFVVSIF